MPWAMAMGGALLLHGLALYGGADDASSVRKPGASKTALTAPMVLLEVPARPATAGQRSVHRQGVSSATAAALESRPSSPARAPVPLIASTSPSPTHAPHEAQTGPDGADPLRGGTQESLPDESGAVRGNSPDAALLKQVPVYPTQLPAAFALALQARRLNPASAIGEQRAAATGQGELRFEPDEQGNYGLRLHLQLGARPLLEMRSQGRLGLAGLEPERLTDRRHGRSGSAANFDRVNQQARFSAGASPAPLATAAQDRLSWLVQLPAVVRADPSLLRPGAVIWLQVVGARGGSQVWRFEAVGPDTVHLPNGTAVNDVWHWRRLAELPYDLQVDAWLGGTAAEVPQLVRLTPVPGGAALEFWPSEKPRRAPALQPTP